MAKIFEVAGNEKFDLCHTQTVKDSVCENVEKYMSELAKDYAENNIPSCELPCTVRVFVRLKGSPARHCFDIRVMLRPVGTVVRCFQ